MFSATDNIDQMVYLLYIGSVARDPEWIPVAYDGRLMIQCQAPFWQWVVLRSSPALSPHCGRQMSKGGPQSPNFSKQGRKPCQSPRGQKFIVRQHVTWIPAFAIMIPWVPVRVLSGTSDLLRQPHIGLVRVVRRETSTHGGKHGGVRRCSTGE